MPSPTTCLADAIAHANGLESSKTGIGSFADAFYRLRISQPFTLFDSKQISDNSPLFFEDVELSGGGSTGSVYDNDRASSTLSVSNLTAGERVRQTKQRFNYQPGKSQLAIFTFVFGTTLTGVTKRVGLCDPKNGIFLENNAGALSLGIRSHVSGAPVDTLVPQANWNIDTMDGEGDSGVTLDETKAQIFFVDYEWLGVGTVAYGFFIDRKPVYVHFQNHANVIDSVYLSNPNLPVRYDITNDGTGAADTFEQICSTVISEGGIQPNGVIRSVDRGATAFASLNNASIFPILSIRLKDNKEFATVSQLFVSILNTSNPNYRWSVVLNPVIAGVDAAVWTPVDKSVVEYDITRDTTNVVTGGYQIASGYVSNAIDSQDVPLENALRLAIKLNGDKDELVLCVQGVTGNTGSYYGAMNYRELL